MQETRRLNELAALYQLTDALFHASSAEDVYEAALDAIERALGCKRASILMFDDGGTMRFVAWRGISDGYRRDLEGHSPWRQGDTEAAPIFLKDILLSDESEAVKKRIVDEGVRGLAFIPLFAGGRVVGKFMTYYDSPHVFSSHENELAVAISRHLGFALERMKSESARQVAIDQLRESEERFRLMSEQAPVMIWTSDAENRCTHLNQLLREFWGVAEDDLSAFDWSSMAHPDDAPALRRNMGDAIQLRQAVDIKARFRNAKGEYRTLYTTAQPRFSRGEFRGMIGVNVDVTEREEVEKNIRQSEERFRLAVEASPSGMIVSDDHGRIVMANRQAEKLFGYEVGELVGEHVDSLVPIRFRPAHAEFRRFYGMNSEARAMGLGRELYGLRKDRTEVPVEIGLSPFESAQGQMVISAVVDISERRRAEDQRELLLAELNHRVKNTLAVVLAIAQQTFSSATSIADAQAAFEGRLIALATAHDQLTITNWQHASLNELFVDGVRASGIDAGRIASSGPSVLLTPKQALALALAFHELLTNAVKHGALSSPTGCISLEWKVTSDSGRDLELTWVETGGPQVTPPKRTGFGTSLLTRVVKLDLDATVDLDYRPGGLVCTIRMPLDP